MRDAVYLAIWLTGLFGLIGLVLAGVRRVVRRDSLEYDRRFLWDRFERYDGEEEERGRK